MTGRSVKFPCSVARVLNEPGGLGDDEVAEAVAELREVNAALAALCDRLAAALDPVEQPADQLRQQPYPGAQLGQLRAQLGHIATVVTLFPLAG